jgi:hypothetical protein
MRKIAALVVVMALGLAARAGAQSAANASVPANDSMLVSTNGIADSVTLTVPNTVSSSESRVGIVDIVINSADACGTISAPDGWDSVITTGTRDGNLCSRIYQHTMAPSEGSGTNYQFSWDGKELYTAKLLFVSNTAGVDVASGEAHFGTAWTPPPLVTNYTGEYLLGFYMNSSNGTWTAPADTVVAQRNTTAGYPDLITRAWQEARGNSDSFEAGSQGGGQWGISQLLAFRPE